MATLKILCYFVPLTLKNEPFFVKQNVTLFYGMKGVLLHYIKKFHLQNLQILPLFLQKRFSLIKIK